MRTICLAAGLAAALHARPALAAEVLIIVQRSPLAGSRHYDGAQIGHELRVGDRLELVREPRNPYDANAIRVDWRGRTLGYVPRRENAAIARQLDRGTALEARVAGTSERRNRSTRIEFEVVAPVAGGER